MSKTEQTISIVIALLMALPSAPRAAEPARIDVVDLMLDHERLQGQRVRLKGVLSASGASLVLADRRGLVDPFEVDHTALDRDATQRMFRSCGHGCRVVVVGEPVVMDDELSLALTAVERPRVKPHKPAPAAAEGRLDVIDLIVDFDRWAGQQVRVAGWAAVWGSLDTVGLRQNPREPTSIFVDATGLSRDDRRHLLTRCQPGCRVVFEGMAGEVYTTPGLIATALVSRRATVDDAR